MKPFIPQLALCRAATLITWPTWAVGVVFKPLTDGVYAYVGDVEGRTYENEGLNANIGLVVTSSWPTRATSRLSASEWG